MAIFPCGGVAAQGLPVEKLPDPAAVAGSKPGIEGIVELAHRLNSFGRHAEAEAAYRRALAMDTRLTRSDDPEFADILINLALEVSDQGRFGEAKALFEHAASVVQKSPDPLIEPRFVAYLAIDAMNQGQFAAARTFARRATALRQKLADSAGGPEAAARAKAAPAGTLSPMLAEGELAHSLMIEAQACYRSGDLAAAEAAGSRAWRIFERWPRLPAWWRPRMMTVLGEIETRDRHLERAETLLKDATARSRDLFGDSQPTALALFALGRYYLASGNVAGAEETFRQGLAMMNLPQQAANQLPFDEIADFLSNSLAAAARQPENRGQLLEEQFLALQRVQTGGSAGILAGTVVRFAADDPRMAGAIQDLQRVEGAAGEIRLQLAEEVARLPEQRDPAHQRRLAEQYRALVGEAGSLRQNLSSSFPDYARLLSPPPATVANIRARLTDGEGFLTVVLGSAFGAVGLVTPTAVVVEKIDMSAVAVDDAVKQLRDAMVIRGGRLAPYDHALAHHLYRQVFGSLEQALASVRHLHLAVSGSLASFPLAALEIAAPESGDDRPVWLIDRFALSNWPSASAFDQLHRHASNSQATRAFLGIGNPRFSGVETPDSGDGTGLCRGGGPFPGKTLAALAPLPDTAAELRRVAALFQADGDDVLTAG
ncbi:MAG TPA: tetratricopeptide repeat protein, partial [Rhodospirillaceae bacterium]|nr:tetratricopeptide repeat protein [Rhodospirillaceae bacterium]